MQATVMTDNFTEYQPQLFETREAEFVDTFRVLLSELNELRLEESGCARNIQPVSIITIEAPETVPRRAHPKINELVEHVTDPSFDIPYDIRAKCLKLAGFTIDDMTESELLELTGGSHIDFWNDESNPSRIPRLQRVAYSGDQIVAVIH